MFRGSFVALITPFRKGQVDERAFVDLVQWQIEEGTHGLVPCGTTGESPTLSHDEHRQVVELCVDAAKRRVPVIAGTGSNSTAEAIELTRHAKKVGAAAALIVTPYYNKPTQAGLYAHFKALHDAVALPIIIYNIPGRSVVDMSVETMAELAKLPRIVGVKDATGDPLRPLRTRRAMGANFCQLSGDDAVAVSFNSTGGVGCISVTANVAPRQVAQVQEALLASDFKRALQLHQRLLALHDAMFVETNPAPVKYAASLLGRSSAALRLPLVGLSPAHQARVKAAMQDAGLLGRDARARKRA
jgi:4-hydroxy-tetrahydrodipicolinate synthase